MTTSVATIRELNETPDGGLIPLAENEAEVVAGGCVLVEPGPKGEPVPSQPF